MKVQDSISQILVQNVDVAKHHLYRRKYIAKRRFNIHSKHQYTFLYKFPSSSLCIFPCCLFKLYKLLHTVHFFCSLLLAVTVHLHTTFTFKTIKQTWYAISYIPHTIYTFKFMSHQSCTCVAASVQVYDHPVDWSESISCFIMTFWCSVWFGRPLNHTQQTRKEPSELDQLEISLLCYSMS